jgi:hypothetical protein
MGSRVPPKDRALNDAAITYLYENNLGEYHKDKWNFQLTNDGAEFLTELKLVDEDELTQAGSTLLALADTPEFKPPMEQTAPFLLTAIQEELLAKEDVAPLFESIEWGDIQLEAHDYEKLNDYLKKQLRKLFDAYVDNLAFPTTAAVNSHTFNSQQVMNIGHINNYGVVNAGTMSDIEQINITTDAMRIQYAEIGTKIKLLTEAVQDAELPEETKERVIDSISTLSTELTKAADQQKKWKISETLDNLGKLLTGGASAYEGYEKVKPYLDAVIFTVKSAFGL